MGPVSGAEQTVLVSDEHGHHNQIDYVAQPDYHFEYGVQVTNRDMKTISIFLFILHSKYSTTIDLIAKKKLRIDVNSTEYYLWLFRLKYVLSWC